MTSRSLITTPIGLGTTTLATAGVVDMLAHLGPTGLFFGGLATVVVMRQHKDIKKAFHTLKHSLPTIITGEVVDADEQVGNVEQVEQVEQGTPYTGRRSFMDRCLGIYPEEVEQCHTSVEQVEQDVVDVSPMFLFSDTLRGFKPSLDRIYLATLDDGTPVFCQAKDLCHVALAGATGNGKTSLIRLLVSQLCKAGASVLILNPHYTRYDVEHDEDWTPFTKYLIADPMVCRKHEVIGEYLKNVATVLLPDRLEKFANSQPVGKPYFIVLDELPAIVKHNKDVPGYLESILQEGRKVGIFLISASQDFLVKTISPNGGGAVRECYRTAYYVGGDARTASLLLDIPTAAVNEVEDRLGVGVVMLRNKATKRATLARVPYVDNLALYRLLGPSTYVPSSVDSTDNNFLEDLTRRVVEQVDSAFAPPAPHPVHPAPLVTRQPLREQVAYHRNYGESTLEDLQPKPRVVEQGVEQVTTGKFTRDIPDYLQEAYQFYTPGMSSQHLASLLGCGKTTAHRYITQMKDRKMIA